MNSQARNFVLVNIWIGNLPLAAAFLSAAVIPYCLGLNQMKKESCIPGFFDLNPALSAVFVISFLSFLVSGLLIVFSTGTFFIDSPCLKVMKFGLSLMTYSASLIFVSRYLPGQIGLLRAFSLLALLGTIMLFAALFLRVFAAFSLLPASLVLMDPLLTELSRLAILPVAAADLLFLFLLRRRTDLCPVLKQSLCWGMSIAAFAFLPGFLLIFAESQLPEVQLQMLSAAGAPAQALDSCNPDRAALRLAHFLGLHALQIVPLIAAFISKLPPSLSLNGRLSILRVCGMAYLGLTALITLQAVKYPPAPCSSSGYWLIGMVIFCSLAMASWSPLNLRVLRFFRKNDLQAN